ncbi:MAG TPA: glycosyltransferase [Gemmatimonadaceae bacterium]|nr:glycosyltransferase [Gemmatimonadaceae bacterium]
MRVKRLTGRRRRPDSAVAVTDFELASPGDAPLLDGAAYAEVCVRLHGAPLGVLQLAAEECAPHTIRRIAAERFAARAQRLLARWNVGTDRGHAPDPVLEALRARAAASDAPAVRGDPSRVTVVVCTRDRPQELARALARLVAAAEGAQLLVIDNSTDGSAAQVCARFPVRMVHEPRPGLDIARNRGIAESRTEVVAFTDDDALADAQWVGTVADAFARNPELSALTGLVLPASLETEAQRRFEAYLGFARGFERGWHHAPRASVEPIVATHGNAGRLGTGANMAFRRSALLRVGGFDPALDAGTAAAGAGDLELFFRVLKAGGLLVYEPMALVRHMHRQERAALDAQIESWGTGMGACLASIARSFPEEAAGTRRLRRSLLMTWFARRWLDSLLSDRDRHALVRREIAGLARGAALYRGSLADDAGPRAFAPLHRDPPATQREAHVDVHADRPLEALRHLDASRVRVRVQLDGAPIGTVALDVVDGSVGTDRLCDAIATAFTARFAGPLGLVQKRLSAVHESSRSGHVRDAAGASVTSA